MFTGIIEELGKVSEITKYPDGLRLTISGEKVREDLGRGDSIAVSGVCLTAAELTEDGFRADVMQETLDSSSLATIAVGDLVNLERAMASSGRFGGHVVQGHVDAVAEIIDRKPSEHWEQLLVRIPKELSKYVVRKGSVTFDGVSLTAHEIEDDVITLSLIPETLRLTNLGSKKVGDKLNLEVDILAKHIEKLIEARSQS